MLGGEGLESMAYLEVQGSCIGSLYGILYGIEYMVYTLGGPG